MTLGVDITSLDFEPLEINQPDGFRGRVIELTCDEWKHWKSPYTNETYQMPDQIWGIVTKPGSLNEIDISVFKSLLEIKAEKIIRVKVKVFFGLFSKSSSYKKVFYEIIERSNTITEAETFVSTIGAYFAPLEIIGLSDEMQIMINILPEQFEDNPTPYYDFISYFGTHYISIAEFGGYIKQIFSTSSKFVSNNKESALSFEAKISFDDFLSSSGGYGGGATVNSKEFLSQTNITTSYHGGDTTLIDEKNILGSKKSIPYNPWLYSGNLVPISKLIKDVNKSASMERAYHVHAAKAYLEELNDQLQNASRKYQFVEASLVNSLLEKTKMLMQSSAPGLDDIKELGEQVNFHLVPGDWWKQTQFCLKTRRVVYTWKECGDLNGPFCAPGFHYTPYYYDRTRSTGSYDCQMSWGLFTPVYAEPWFKNIQLCFRFEPTADLRQCGNPDQQKEFCTVVNKYTEEYLDATSNFHGGCHMSWKIKTTGTIPYWFQNTQLCLHLNIQSPACQAGPHFHTTLCAQHNNWTPIVYDSSYSSRYNCGYQWGLIEILS
ncbi:perivitellin-2 67 kDa subunit-like [Convolutriloba macropyga]|uniref:perivitellin-2 67 kDa subunit-like n=1 Tax=Convolutriloba macropyga TaxID=536237 RepID=UPI003F51C748